MFFKRKIASVFRQFAQFPVLVLLGPRQSGKTTLAKEFFHKYVYVTLEDPETLALVNDDPRKFLREHENKHGIIIDEFQHAPQLLSYIQIEVDEKDRPGYFVLTGSQNFLMNEAITQSLAGRAGILHLLPLALHELTINDLAPATIDSLILNGGYPRTYAKGISPRVFFPSYVRTYLERDVRQLVNVGNLRTFQKFMRLCAGRIGQLLNIEELATTCGISRQTAVQWLSTLEASYIIFFLQPHFNNFNKRLTKAPKLYFYDTGLACYLLGINLIKQLQSSPFRGPLFECLVIADLYKQYYNRGLEASLYFWRDQNGRTEVDCIIDQAGALVPIEIKSGETISSDFFDALERWTEMAKINPSESYIVYAGDKAQSRSRGKVITLTSLSTFIDRLYKE